MSRRASTAGGSLAYLLACNLRGRVVRVLRKLRQPRYLIGALVTAAWLFFVFGNSLGDGANVRIGMAPELAGAMTAGAARAAQTLLCLLVAIILSLWWLVPWGRRPLELDETELHVLLPAPLSRRSVIQYAVLKSQSGVLVGTLVLTVFWGGSGIVDRLATLPAFWLLLTTWDLHGKARGLWLARQGELSRSRAWARRGVLLVLVAAFWVAALGAITDIVALALSHPWEQGGTSVRELLAQMGRQTADGPLAWLLAPLRWVTEPLFHRLVGGGGLLTGLRGWLPAIGLLLLHDVWVVRSQVRFEEATLRQARERARKSDPAARFWRISERGRRRVPFALSPRGRPEVAVVWKNLILFRRGRLLTACAAGVLLAAALTLLLTLPGIPEWLPWGVLFGSIALLPLGPFITGRSLRNDLRADLLKIELIRPWPIAGWRLFVGEIAAPVTLASLQVGLTGSLLLFIDLAVSLGALDLGAGPRAEIAARLGVPAPALVPLALVSYLPVAVVVAALSSALENLAALLFPSWVHLGLEKKQAAAGFGQNLIVFLVLSLAFMLGMLPGALAVAVTLAIQLLAWGVPLVGWELPLLGAIGALPVAAVVVALVLAGGRTWERLDPSDELLAGGT